jgi:hypothetical protein
MESATALIAAINAINAYDSRVRPMSRSLRAHDHWSRRRGRLQLKTWGIKHDRRDDV